MTEQIPPSEAVALVAGNRSMIFDVSGATPVLLHFGAELAATDLAVLAEVAGPPTPQAGIDRLAPLSLVPEAGSGFPGHPGLSGSRPDGGGWAPRGGAAEVSTDGSTLRTSSTDPVAGVQIVTSVALDATGVATLTATVTNTGDTPYLLEELAVSAAMPGWARDYLSFTGRWSDEFEPQRGSWATETIYIDNRRGRTSPDRFPAVFVGTPGFSEESGEVIAFHLAWSGNTSVRLEPLSDGRRHVQLAELLLPGEMVLEPGESYTTPEVLTAYSNSGLNGISDAFHAHLRARPGHPTSPRPVHLNTWEAVYFNHNFEVLSSLAEAAAEVGIERYVLDDGWFGGRRHERAGLGDWWVSPDAWPNGLGPIVDKVTGLGMEFGLWVEPEMVNPDSELYRNHPDWVLTHPGYEPELARHQLVLDLTNPEVGDYLFESLSPLLRDLDIGYLKWDMNRDLVHPTHNDRATVHHQIEALYALLDRFNQAFPDVEIESCSSGGARIDAAILRYTKRFWTSDCNDALDRQRIQRGFSYLFPPEVMGAHIGPPTSHTTARTQSLDLRGASALFGHLGVEWNIVGAGPEARERLAKVIAVHKRFRPLLHSGRVRRFDHPNVEVVAHAVIAADQSEALVSVAQVATSPTHPVAPVRITGLDPGRQYRVEEVPLPGHRRGPAKSAPDWVAQGVTVSGQTLATVGVSLPILHPESAMLIHVSGVG
jgi:alpha-galactosidase